jgi:hypothetical protein
VTVCTVDLLRSWTEADLDELPDHVWRSEIIDGRLLVQAPAGESHQAATIELLEQLRDQAPFGWRVRFGGLAIGEDRLVPDLLVLPPDTPPANDAYNDVAVIKPQLVVEIARLASPMAFCSRSRWSCARLSEQIPGDTPVTTGLTRSDTVPELGTKRMKSVCGRHL